MRRVELREVGFGDTRLFGRGRKNRRAVLRADVRPLPIELGGIVRDGEVNLQDLAIRDLARVEGDLYRFGVAGRSGADDLVLCRALIAAGVARDGAGHTCDVLKHSLHTPETAAREHRHVGTRLCA